MNDPYKGLQQNVVNEAPTQPIMDMLAKILWAIRNHKKIMVGISGGSDSDIMLDAISKIDVEKKVTYVFFNTGLETDATKRHLKYLEDKYGIKIEDVKPIMPIPICCKKYGVPFWSKQVSENIYRLQRHGFKWEDRPFSELILEYPKCTSPLKWWCNEYRKDNGDPSSFNISYVRGLTEFILANPITFKVSDNCCHYAKKEPAKKFVSSTQCDMNCVGVRKAEGGKRATAIKTCYTQALAGPDQYRPLFWFTDADKAEYDSHYGIEHSDCYKVWGMKRTGCAGCPLGKDFESELMLAEKYEPKFHRAMLNVFGASYDYTRRFLEFRSQMNIIEKGEGQAS